MTDILISSVIIFAAVIINSIVWYHAGKCVGRKEGFYTGRFVTLNYFLSKEKENFSDN